MEWEVDTAEMFSLVSLYWMGEFAELRQRVPDILAGAKKRGNFYTLTNVGSFAAAIALAADDVECAEQQLREYCVIRSQREFLLQDLYELYNRIQNYLYRGDASIVWQYVVASQRVFARSLLPRIQNIRVMFTELRATCALAVASTSSDPESYLRSAGRDARRLEREKMPWTKALAGLIYGMVAANRGDVARGIVRLKEAIALFDEVDMVLYGASARRCLGLWLGGDEGHDLVAEADAWMVGQRVQNPERLSAVFAPECPLRGTG
jgi:hypothetical protein